MRALRHWSVLLGFSWCGCGLIVGSEEHHLQSVELAADAETSSDTDVRVVSDSGKSDEDARGDSFRLKDAESGSSQPDVLIDSPADVRVEATLLASPVVIARGRHAPSAIAVDSSAVYWLEPPHDAQEGTIWKLAKAQGANPMIVASGLTDPRSIALSEGDVYATDGAAGGDAGTGGLYRVAKTGGAAVRIDTDSTAGFGMVVLDADYAYTEAPISSTVSKRLRRSAKNGNQVGNCDIITSSYANAWVGPLAVDADALYYAHSGLQDTKKVVKVCNVLSGALKINAEVAQTLVIDDTNVFWAMPDGTVRRHDENTDYLQAAALTLVDGGGAAPSQHHIALSATDVFIASLENGTVAMVGKTGGGLHQIASSQGEPSSIAVDSDSVVYWTNQLTGEIVTMHSL